MPIIKLMDSIFLILSTLGNGIITAMLTWGSNPDIDLHVFEPNGTHVYYTNFLGI